MYTFNKTKNGIVIGLVFVLNLFFVTCLFAGQPKNHTPSNIKASRFTVSWNTDLDEKAKINYGITPALGDTAEDERGTVFEGSIHYLNAEGLSPETVYYYDIISGDEVYDNDGSHWTVKTSGYLDPLPDSDIVYGQVLQKDRVTSAEGAIVYIKVRDNNGIGTPDDSQILTCLTDKDGNWYIELKNLRSHTLDAYFDYSQQGDLLVIEARGADGDYAAETVDTSEIGSALPVILQPDTTPPVTKDDYDGNWHNSDFIISLSASDERSDIKETNYRINNGIVQSVGTAGQPVIDREGNNNILEYWSVDTKGNEELPHKALSGIKLDKTPPIVNIISPENEQGFSEGPIIIEGSIKDGLSGAGEVEVYVNSTRYFPELTPSGSFSVIDVEILPGSNIVTVSARDIAGNISEDSITVFLGWVLHLKIPYYGVGDYYSGAACLQMVLNYIRNGVKNELTQEEIYNYGHPYNYQENTNIAELDPRGIDFALGHFDPYDTNDPKGEGDAYRGYNFSIESFAQEQFNEYLRDIIHWMAYPVTIDYWYGDDDTLTAWPNTPAVIPAYGGYENWIVVNGASVSEDPVPDPKINPWYTPEFTVYGLWLTDPSVNGISGETYVTPDVLKDTYFFPIVSLDAHNGKYIQVAEPPIEMSKAEIRMVLPNINEKTLKLIDIADYVTGVQNNSAGNFEKRLEGIKKHIYDAALVVDIDNDIKRDKPYFTAKEDELLESIFDGSKPSVELDWKGIIDASLFTDKRFREILDKSYARDFIKVRRVDKENSSYYLIPFDKYTKGLFLTCAALIIDAENGSFKQASWVNDPVRFVQIDRSKAEKTLVSKYPQLQDQDIELDSELIWEPGRYSASPFYPYWKITAESEVYFVTQEEEVIKDVYSQNKD